MTRALITPVVDHVVPKPDGTPLARAGEHLDVTSYWRRRARDGDVSIGPVRVTPAVAGSGQAAVRTPVKAASKGD